MLSSYYRFIKIPFNFFNKDDLDKLVIKELDKSKNKHWNHLTNIFNKDSHEFFSKFQYNIINAELFYTPPYGRLLWHIDMNPPEDFMKINIVWGSKNHKMAWGELVDTNKKYPTSKTEVSSQYIKLDDNEVIPKESITVDKPIIANVGRPHKILNDDINGRWCLSIMLTKNNKRILFKDAIIDLSEYVVN